MGTAQISYDFKELPVEVSSTDDYLAVGLQTHCFRQVAGCGNSCGYATAAAERRIQTAVGVEAAYSERVYAGASHLRHRTTSYDDNWSDRIELKICAPIDPASNDILIWAEVEWAAVKTRVCRAAWQHAPRAHIEPMSLVVGQLENDSALVRAEH